MKVPEPRKLKSGTWFIQMRLGGESIPVSAPTRTECVKQAEKIKADYPQLPAFESYGDLLAAIKSAL